MKLTRTELIHAQDKQLATLGVKRDGNSGWLKECMALDFTPEAVEMFHSARRKTKADKATAKAQRPPTSPRTPSEDACNLLLFGPMPKTPAEFRRAIMMAVLIGREIEHEQSSGISPLREVVESRA